MSLTLLLRFSFIATATLLLREAITPASAAHTDVVAYLEGSSNWPFGTLGTLRVGSHDFGSGEMITLNVLVFAGTTKNFATQPGWVSNIDPGWTQPFEELYPQGTHPLAPLDGSLFLESIVDPRLGHGLMVWDGNGEVDFEPVTTGEVLELSIDGRTLTIGSGVHAGNSMLLTDLSSDTFHLHTVNRIWGDASHNPADNPNPGFYLYGLRFRLEDRGETRISDVFYIIMANGFDKYTYETVIIDGEEVELEKIAPQMQTAMNWANQNLAVPEPSSLMLLIAGATTLGLRRLGRRSRS